MEEIWKDIKGFEGKYEVSNYGRVRSSWFSKERVLSARKNTNGYLHVCLYKDGKRKEYLVHRLVAEAFIPNPDNLPCVNHKDETRDNNVVSNLEFCDAAYNNSYGTRTERTSKPVYQYTLDGSLVKSYPSTHEAERQTGYAQNNISACCLGKYKKAYGYIWSYALLSVKGKLF